MFYIVEVQGCEPYLGLVMNQDESDEALSFNSEKEAQSYAIQNCTWDYQIVEF